MRPRALPPAWRALAAQCAGWGVAALAVRSGLLPASAWSLAIAQALAATVCAAALHSARWWLPIHLSFTPAVLLTGSLHLPPWLFLLAFLLLLMVYWSSFRTQVPLYLSNSSTADAILALLPMRPQRVLDLGSGTGSVLTRLARARPDLALTGIEAAPLPHAIAAWRLRHTSAQLLRGDFFEHSWADYDCIYAFLSPVPMEAVWLKARREMKPSALLISNSFPVPGQAARCIEVDDRRHTRLYLYQPASGEAQN